ncbi:MAG: Glucose-repressible alcohol dehydrogenase transcriptional effector [Cirrosporium novae-zelandiae]|nr:MAG: Glucose-repressible alcohol dehydrogenase transcriptional effector [Cirrosporium novae-zelandiae]
MADGTYRFQQTGAGQYYYQTQQNHQRQQQQHLTRNGSPVSNGRIGGFSSDTPSPTRSPISHSPAYNMYSQNHQQSQHPLLNGNHPYRFGGLPINLTSKHHQPNHQNHHTQQHHHQQPQPQHQQQHHGHALHTAHSGNLTHHHTFSSGGLSSTTPHFTSMHLQNGTPNSAHEDLDESQMTEHWQQQQQIAVESRSAQERHYHAKRETPTKLQQDRQTNGDREEQEPQERPIRVNNLSKSQKSQACYLDGLDFGGLQLRVVSESLFFNYARLEKLYLNYNQLTQLPPFIGRLSNLQVLDVSHNNITELPQEIGMLTNLRTLNLVDNNIRSLPDELGSLHRLELLGIEGNPLEDGVRRQIMDEGTKGLITWLRENANVHVPPSDRDWIILDDTPVPPSGPPPDKFSLLNYNTLCDKYATTNQYGYTASKYLSWDFRKQNILNEVKDRDADVVCLQEVDMDSFNEYFRPELAYSDYKGIFWPKSRARTMGEKEAKAVDGCATFYKSSKFIMLDKQVIDFANTAINRPDMKGEHDIFNRVMPRDNIAVVAFLENRVTGSRLIVVNVHIFWDPSFEDVKLVQTAILMEQVAKLASKYAKYPACTDKVAIRFSEQSDDSTPITPPEPLPEPGPSLEYSLGSQIPLVICGDFNSTRDSGVYQLLSQGYVPNTHPDLERWTYGSFTRDGISHPLNLKSSYGNIGELPFTNYTPGFTDVIDYIWYSTNALQVTALLGEVDPEYLQRVPGFPNDHFPSDHLALLAEFSVKSKKERKVVEVDFGPQSRDKKS